MLLKDVTVWTGGILWKFVFAIRNMFLKVSFGGLFYNPFSFLSDTCISEVIISTVITH